MEVSVENRKGSVAEWSNALDLGSVIFDDVGSNPTAANIFLPWNAEYRKLYVLLCWIIECNHCKSLWIKASAK